MSLDDQMVADGGHKQSWLIDASAELFDNSAAQLAAVRINEKARRD